MDEASARAEARRRFGDIDEVRKECRMLAREREQDVRRSEYMAETVQDARLALRHLLRAPGFTVVAVLTLALGIGPTTAIFSALRAVVLKPFAFAHPERTVAVYERFGDLDGNVSAGNFVDYQGRSLAFEHLAAVQWTNVNLAGAEAPERVLGARVSWDFFNVFGTPPLRGRTFLPEEDDPARADVVVLSQGLWERRFGADPGAVGAAIRLDGKPHTIVGVMPAGFNPVLGDEQLWLPIAFTPERKAMHDEHYLTVVGLLKDGTSLAQARADMDGVARGLAQEFPKDNQDRGARVALLSDDLIGDSGQ
jgi:hypothetical protein